MDPVSALGVAAAVVQFVQFASNLLTGTLDIYQSASGSSTRVQDLDSLYTDLSGLSDSLRQHHGSPNASSSSASTTLQKLASSCKDDCDELLAIVKELKCRRVAGHWWKSMKTAFKEVGKQDEIGRLQDNIRHRQSDMILAICATSSESIQALQNQIEDSKRLSEQLCRAQADKLRAIEANLAKAIQQNAQILSNTQRPVSSNMGVEELIKNLSNLSLDSQDVSESLKREKILESLRDAGAPVRHADIPEAHERTFKWTLKEPNLTQAESNESHHGHQKKGQLLRWLRDNNGIFWVSGKPGSGKSTFMKFIADNAETRKALSSWASPLPVIVASHYFWSMGNKMQRSQLGLWQSLLRQVLENQSAQWFQTACPDRWESNNPSTAPWSISELQKSLTRIIEQQSSKTRFCFFVDGMDEFDGDHEDLVPVCTQLSQFSAVKMCLASRPENAFEKYLGKSATSKICLHELTRNDIMEHSRSRLTAHPEWTTTVSPQDGDSLIPTITDRAQGVFFWVFLVVNQLRKSLTDCDYSTSLHHILNSVPSDLETLFEQMLHKVPHRLHERMAGFLEITLAAHRKLHYKLYYFYDRESVEPGFSLKAINRVGPDSEFENEFEDKLIDEHERIKTKVHPLLKASCKGLLDISSSGQVEFIHRTVGNWLQKPSTREFLKTKLKPDFDARVSILHAFLADYKGMGWIPEGHDEPNICQSLDVTSLGEDFDEVFQYAQDDDYDPTFPKGQVYPILDKLSMANCKTPELSSPEGTYFNPADDHISIIRRSLFHQELWSYLSTKCQEDAQFLRLAFLPYRNYVWVYDISSVLEKRKCTNEAESARRNVATLILSDLVRQVFNIADQARHNTMQCSDDALFSIIFDLYQWSGADPSTIVKLGSETSMQMRDAFVPTLLYYAAPRASIDKEVVSDILASHLTGTDASGLLRKFKSGRTLWDVICGRVRTLRHDFKSELRSGRDKLTSYNFAGVYLIIQALITYVRGIGLESWKDLGIAIKEGFLPKESDNLMKEMTSFGLLDENESGERKRKKGGSEPTQPEKRARVSEMDGDDRAASFQGSTE